MQDMLVPIFGENGAIIFQYVISLAVILGLIALIVWAIRRYGRGAVGPAARGRLPRLAVVDALAIDNKRRLVLVRRDNVEHLVLIGGPTDVVVEPSIVRQRVAQRPGQPTPTGRTTQIPTAAPQPPPPPPAPSPQSTVQAAPRVLPTRTPVAEAAPGENAIPFPPRRSPARATERFVSPPRRESTRTAMAASALAASEPLADHAVARRAPSPAIVEKEREAVVAEPDHGRFAPPDRPARDEPPDEPVPGYPPDGQDDQETVNALRAARRSASRGRARSRTRRRTEPPRGLPRRSVRAADGTRPNLRKARRNPPKSATSKRKWRGSSTRFRPAGASESAAGGRAFMTPHSPSHDPHQTVTVSRLCGYCRSRFASLYSAPRRAESEGRPCRVPPPRSVFANTDRPTPNPS